MYDSHVIMCVFICSENVSWVHMLHELLRYQDIRLGNIKMHYHSRDMNKK